MMAQWELALIVTLIVLLAAVSAFAGGLWWKLRSKPDVVPAYLIEMLTACLRSLDEVLTKLEAAPPSKSLSADPSASPMPFLRAAPEGRKRFTLSDPPRTLRVDEPGGVSPTLIEVPDLAEAAGRSEEATSAAATELAQRFATIWELAAAGETADTIAQRTGQPIGQVELILGLRRQLGIGPTGSKRP
jgi:hypothetical protein